MTLFMAISSVLLILVLAVLVFPLLRSQPSGTQESATFSRELNAAVLNEQLAELKKEHAAGQIDEAAYDLAREDLEARALEDLASDGRIPETSSGKRPRMALVLLVAFSMSVVAIYLALGSPDALREDKQVAMGGGGNPHAVGPEQIQAMVQRLSEKLQDNPNDGNGWLMLARSYGTLGRYPESAAAYGRAIALLPPNAQTLADFADIVAMAQGRKLQGDPEKIIKQALEIDPNNVKALALAGTVSFDRQDFRGAIAHWRKILTLVPEDSQVAARVQTSIHDAENRMELAKKK